MSIIFINLNKINAMNRIVNILMVMILLSGCKDDKVTSETQLSVEKDQLEFSNAGGTQTLQVTTNQGNFDISVDNISKEWCNVEKDGDSLLITTAKNETQDIRKATITIATAGKKELIFVTQLQKALVSPDNIKLTISGGEASSQETAGENNRFANSYDGNLNTIWHSKWSETNKFPFTLTYHLENADELNYIVYYPRNYGYNGNFGKIEIQALTEGATDFVSVMEYDCGKKRTESKIMLPRPVIKPKSIRIIIKSGEGGYASCAEMEFYKGTGEDLGEGVEVPLGGNSYVSVKGRSGKIADTGFTGWSDPATVFSTFFRVNKEGNLYLYLKYRTDANNNQIEVSCKGQKFQVTLVKPANNTDGIAFIGRIDECDPGYVQVDFKGINKQGSVFATPSALILKGSATEDMNYVDDFSYYWGRRGPSVHMNYTIPSSTTAEWFYNEVTVPVGMDPIGSYFMSNGFNEGYFGIQVNSATERRVLFSVWSPYNTDDPSQIPESKRVKLVKKGEGVRTGEFGNEGAGGQSYLVFNWRAGNTYKFLTRIRPSQNGYSEYTSYFFAPETGNWRLIAQFLRPETTTYYRGAHSFLENFSTETGYITRKAYYNNQWVYTREGNWVEITKGRFTADDTARAGARLDYRGGVDSSGFFLQNCGFFNDYTIINSYFDRAKTNNPPNIPWNELN